MEEAYKPSPAALARAAAAREKMSSKAQKKYAQKSGETMVSSATKAKKSTVDASKEKARTALSLKAYGATKGTKMGGEEPKPEKDTVTPLTRDQHSKVQAAKKAAGAVSKADRMSMIARAVRKSKERFDVPNVEDDDEHDSLSGTKYAGRKSYSEASIINPKPAPGGQVAAPKQFINKRMKTIHLRKEETQMSDDQVNEKYMGFKKLKASISKKGGARDAGAVAAAIGRKKYGKEKFQAMAARGKRKANEEVEQIDEYSQKEIKMAVGVTKDKRYAGGNMTGAVSAMEKIKKGLSKHLAVKAALRKANEEVEQVDEGSVDRMELIKAAAQSKKMNQNPNLTKKTSIRTLVRTHKLHSFGSAANSGYSEKKGSSGLNRFEEVEQVDEVNARFDPERATTPTSKDVKNWQQRDKNPRAKAAAMKYIRRQQKIGGLGPDATKKDYEQHMKDHFDEETEQTSGYLEERLSSADPASKWISDFVKSDNPKFAGKSKKERINMALGAYYSAKRSKNEEVEQVDETSHEGRTPTTPKEKELAAHHGDPKKITYGDVVKARIKAGKGK